MADDVQNLKIIKDFLTEIKAQDNRGTALPIYYTIVDYEKEFVPSNSGEPFFYFEGKLLSYEDYCKECESITLDEFESLPEIYYGEQHKRSFQRGVFLTESDAKEHLRKNYYHYSPKAHTYVCHIWRAPKLEAFLKALIEFFGISGEEKDKPLYGTYKKAGDYDKASLKGEKNV